jgi:hypothetical protein
MTRSMGSKGQVRLLRWLIVAVVVVLVLGSAGMSYARMQGGWQNRGVVSTTCCPEYNYDDDYFTWVVSNDDGSENSISPYGVIDPGDDGGGTNHDIWGGLSSDDPSEPQTMGVGGARYDKDVARTTASISDDHTEITVTIENAYPSYYPTVFFGLNCPDSTPGTITSIVIDNPYPDELTVTTSGIDPGSSFGDGDCSGDDDGDHDDDDDCWGGDWWGDDDDDAGCGGGWWGDDDCCGDDDDDDCSGDELVGAVHVHLEQPAAQDTCYTFTISIGIDCGYSAICETAYAYHADYATCFLDMGFARWGWTNGPLEPGYYQFELWAGAAQCDTSQGTDVGWLTVDYDGSTAVVTYNVYAGNYMTATQLYVGNDPLPEDPWGNETVAPGQYPYKHEHLSNVTTDSYTVTGLSGDIYVVAHADVCWGQHDGDDDDDDGCGDDDDDGDDDWWDNDNCWDDDDWCNHDDDCDDDGWWNNDDECDDDDGWWGGSWGQQKSHKSWNLWGWWH